MENNYYKLLNFVTKLSQPKMSDSALDTKSRLDEGKGEYIIDIFENGIDNAEAIIAIEARKLLQTLSSTQEADITQMIKETQSALLSDEDIIRKAFEATGGHVSRMVKMTGMPTRTIYNKLDKYGLDRRKYNFNNKNSSQEDMSLKDVEIEHIHFWLAKCNGNKTEAAKRLGVTVKTIYNKLEAFNSQPST